MAGRFGTFISALAFISLTIFGPQAHQERNVDAKLFQMLYISDESTNIPNMACSVKTASRKQPWKGLCGLGQFSYSVVSYK